MSKFELNNGSGFIFKNDRKQSENHPDYRGTIKTPEGDEFDISLWVKSNSKGSYFSVAVNPPYVPEEKEQQAPPKSAPKADYKKNDDLPF